MKTAKTLREANGLINKAPKVMAGVLIAGDVADIEVTKKAAKAFIANIFESVEVYLHDNGTVYISNNSQA